MQNFSLLLLYFESSDVCVCGGLRSLVAYVLGSSWNAWWPCFWFSSGMWWLLLLWQNMNCLYS